MVAVEFARFFGLPAPARANLTDVTNAVCATAAHTRVDLVLVDEIHNISLATRAGAEYSQFSAARIFAAAYPEAVTIASLIASPAWRCLAAGNPAQQQKFIAAIGQRLGWPGYQPPDTGDAIAHWMKYDSRQPPSRPHTTFPQAHGYGPARRVTTSMQSLRRHERSTQWFRVYRRGGRVILHHSHVWPV